MTQEAEDLLSKARAKLIRASKSAPHELADEFDTVVDSIDDLADLVADANDEDSD